MDSETKEAIKTLLIVGIGMIWFFGCLKISFLILLR
jgi:hypothetical protein